MRKQILHYRGVYGEQEQPFWDTQIHVESLIKRSEVFNFEINEHLHSSLIQIFVLKEGGGILTSEGKSISLKTPCITFIPNGVLHGFSWQPDIVGTVMTISTSFFDNILAESEHIAVQFQDLRYFSFVEDTTDFNDFLPVIIKLQLELQSKMADKKDAIKILLHLFMIHLYRKQISKNSQIIATENRTLVYFSAFQKELKNDTNRSKSIKEYAKALNITPVHLNRVCQSLVQKSALQIIHEKIAIEAKKYLLYTDKTIEEISYELHFTDPSHFSKFFKKTIGISPRTFRKKEIVKSIV